MSSRMAVTAIVNSHREGLLCLPSLRSLTRARSFAEQRGVDVESIVVLDRPDDLTWELVTRWGQTERGKVIVVDNGDAGISRNQGVSAASAEWIAFLDADDLWGETWLFDAVMASRHDQRNIVWHPEINIYFGRAQHIFRHIDMEDAEFKLWSLVGSNYWTSLCFARRELLLHIPYPRTVLSKKIGFEDWGWNRATIAAGVLHKIVRGAGHAIRVRSMSLVKQTAAGEAIPSPTDLFRNELQTRLPRKP